MNSARCIFALISALMILGCTPDNEQETPEAPIANAGPDKTVDEGASTTLDGSATDADSTELQYQWRQVSGTQASLSNANQAVANVTAPQVARSSQLVFELKVTDETILISRDRMTLTVNNNNLAPTVSAGDDKVVEEGSSVTLIASATDNDGNQFTYQWEQFSGPDVDASGANTAQLTFTAPQVDDATVLQFRVTVTDADGATATDTVSVTVTNAVIPPDTGTLEKRTRYQHNNQCYAMLSLQNEQYVRLAGGSYTADAEAAADAEKFYLRPAALGHYILYNSAGELLIDSGNAATGAALGTQALADVADPTTAIFTLTAVGDTTEYPPTPAFHTEPTKAQIDSYRAFSAEEPNILSAAFTLSISRPLLSESDGSSTEPGSLIYRLALDDNNALTLAASENTDNEFFHFEASDGCAEFAEATSNTVGESYKGTNADGYVIGHADVHVHISSTNFLGMTQWGNPYHPLGVTHALGDCTPFHGETGEQDTVGQLFSEDYGPHDTTGWPTFPLWPARDLLTHEAIYWGWLERAWKGGLRVIVTDLVDNETLCELQRPSSPEPEQDCNAMNNVGKQAGSMYGMQDYIDAQYGGRGDGFYQIVHDSAEARMRIAEGKAAVVLGIEISNFLDCKVTYSPSRTQQPFQEDGSSPGENTWGCSMDPADIGSDIHVDTQLNRLWDLGVRQIVSIHEFDNALGGNGIFDSFVLNAGNRENSGGIPAQSAFGSDIDPFQTDAAETGGGTGEFWTTYDCPQPGDENSNFRGWFGGGGTVMQGFPSESPFQCADGQKTGQGGRHGGALPCYPAAAQCNARLMTPLGLYVYTQMMKMGFIFDWDHMEIGMKTQALQLQELQDPPYPVVSTHGNFGGTTIDQAERLYKNGGHLFPSLGGANSFANRVRDTKAAWEAAEGSEHRVNVFGLGYGTDTNGLSAQAGSRHTGNQITGEEVRPESVGQAQALEYPFTLFGNDGTFAQYPELFSHIDPITFEQPEVRDPNLGDDPAQNGRLWHIDEDGSAHYGLLADFVEELNIEAQKAGPITHNVYENNVLQPEPGVSYHPERYQDALEALFLSAEAYLQTWQKTEFSSEKMRERAVPWDAPEYRAILRRAPIPDVDDPADYHFDNWGKEGGWEPDPSQGGGGVTIPPLIPAAP